MFPVDVQELIVVAFGEGSGKVECGCLFSLIPFCSVFFFKYKFIYFNWRLITLQYCIGFVQLFYNLDHILIQKKIF